MNDKNKQKVKSFGHILEKVVLPIILILGAIAAITFAIILNNWPLVSGLLIALGLGSLAAAWNTLYEPDTRSELGKKLEERMKETRKKSTRIEFFWPIVFVAIGILGIIMLPLALADRNFSDLEEIEGIIQTISVSTHNENTIEIIVSDDQRSFWVIPRSARLITAQNALSVETIEHYFLIGMSIRLDVIPFRGNLAVVGAVNNDTVILDLQQSINQAQSDSNSLLISSIALTILLPIGIFWLVRSSIKFSARKKLKNHQSTKEN